MTTETVNLGKYQLLEKIGQGGAGEVFLAFQPSLDRKLVIKIMTPDLALDSKHLQRFKREARTAACLNHPNIIQIYDIDEINGQHFIVMEYVQGVDLAEVIKRRRRLPLSAVITIASNVAAGLKCAHEFGIVHRDLKPHNILLGVGGRVKVADFGLARRFEVEDRITASSVLVGTPMYMSPEQASGHEPDIRSDIYAFGVTLYECLTGYLPFNSENAVGYLYAHCHNPPHPLPEEVVCQCPLLAELIMQMLAKSVDDRPQTPHELLQILEKCRAQVKAKNIQAESTTQIMRPKLRLCFNFPDGSAENCKVYIIPIMTIGRHPDNHIQVRDGSIHRMEHARIEVQDENLVLIPNNEKGQLLLNGVMIPAIGAPLQVGDKISIGNTVVVIEPEKGVTEEDISESIRELAERLKKIDISEIAIRRQQRKEENLALAKELYDANRPWCGRLAELMSENQGKATMAAKRVLRENGYSAVEASRLVREMKGERSDHIRSEDVVQESKDFCGLPLKDSETALIIPSTVFNRRLHGYTWGDIIRYRNCDWIPIKKREVEKNTFLYLRRCK